MHTREFLEKCDTEEFEIVQVLDKLDYHPVSKDPGDWYKVRKLKGHNRWVWEKKVRMRK